MSKIHWMFSLLVLVAFNVLGQEGPPNQAKALVPKEISFTPPKDTIISRSIDVSCADEFQRIRLEKLVAARERTLSIPLRNITDEDLVISNVSVSCGCMAAIANSKILTSNETTNLYLRISPTETGNFIKSATVTFANHSQLKLVIEAKIEGAFSIKPASIVLRPNDQQGQIVTVTSNFGEESFNVKSMEPSLSITVIKHEGKVLTARCVFADDVKSELIPHSTQVPIVVSGVRGSHEYMLTVHNEDSIEIKPAFMIAGRRGVNKYRFYALIMSHRDDVGQVECVLPASAKRLSLTLVDQRGNDVEGSHTTFNNYEIEGDVSGQDSVLLKWMRSGKLVETTEVFFDRNSAIAIEKMREARRELNSELIRNGNANAISDP